MKHDLHVINSNSIKEAWIEAKRAISEAGKFILDGKETLKEYFNLFLTIDNPETSGQEDPIENGDMRDWMLSNFREIKNVKELNDSKSYAWRLHAYHDKDQIRWVKEKLKKKPETKSATITTFFPTEDEYYIPCVSLLDFKIREETLILSVTCRSLDFGMKALYNLYCLSDILHDVGTELDISKRRLEVHVISAHLYEKDAS